MTTTPDGRWRRDGQLWVPADDRTLGTSSDSPIVRSAHDAPERRSLIKRRSFLALIPLTYLVLRAGQSASASTSPATLIIIAHEDDDLLFFSPDLINVIQSGGNLTTIFVTAGDDGQGGSYWQSREEGSQAAYAEMVGVANSWTQQDAGVSGHPMPMYTLTGAPAISLIFMHIPDGNIDGSGFASNNYASLQDLWTGSISSIEAVDGSSSYTKSSLVSTLAGLMGTLQPDQILTQDYVGTYGGGDHSDHYSVAYFTQSAQQQYTKSHTLTGYLGYPIANNPANVSGTDLTAKQNAFYTYAAYDIEVAYCSTQSGCAGTEYETYLERQYTVSTAPAPVADAGAGQTVQVGSTVQLDGSGSTAPAGDSLTYQWSQTGGTAVTLSSTTAVQPTFTAPASPDTLTFQLVVNDGQTSSAPAAVTITITSVDLALSATATASSQNTSTGQLASSAIDGVVDGYPGDYTKEWATVGGGAGSWLKLTWTSAQTFNTIVLYDRPNLNDQITGGNIQFGDGSSIPVGTLPNDGSAYTLTFADKTETSLQLNITSVSDTTQNIGLAEIQVYQSG
jgi:LmbE family N-acetylglucosaminyl deacetylase